MKTLPNVFVCNVGLKSVTICGEKCKDYLTLPNSRVARDAVIIDCMTERDLIGLLQELINQSIPFESTYKSQAARSALFYKAKGELTGKVISFEWGSGGAVYKEE